MVDVDEEVYDDSIEEKSEENLDDDEISPEEQGFLKGYDEAYVKNKEEDLDKEFE